MAKVDRALTPAIGEANDPPDAAFIFFQGQPLPSAHSRPVVPMGHRPRKALLRRLQRLRTHRW